jgi:hypothetical protein
MHYASLFQSLFSKLNHIAHINILKMNDQLKTWIDRVN